MKTLKESILDNFSEQTEDIKRKRIEEWLKEHNAAESKYIINKDFSIDIESFIYKGHGDFPDYIQFNECDGDFSCDANMLTTLRGCPKRVYGTFHCGWNDLKSLKYCPEYINNDFFCHNCDLISLKGCPEKIGGSFNCESNKLKNLIGGPQKVGSDYICKGNELITLKGTPDTIHGIFDCSSNKLKKYDGPKDVYELIIRRNYLSAEAIQWIRENVKYGTLKG